MQPYATYNLVHGYYLRTSAIMQFNTSTNTSVIPIGIGVGKVIQLPGGYTLNAYAEVHKPLELLSAGKMEDCGQLEAF